MSSIIAALFFASDNREPDQPPHQCCHQCGSQILKFRDITYPCRRSRQRQRFRFLVMEALYAVADGTPRRGSGSEAGL